MMCSPRELHLPNAPQNVVLLNYQKTKLLELHLIQRTLDRLGNCQYLIDQIEGNKMAKNVVITGATSGIGEAIARAYLEQGENVVLTGRRTDRLEALKSGVCRSFSKSKSLDLFVRCHGYGHGKDGLLRYSRNDRSD